MNSTTRWILRTGVALAAAALGAHVAGQAGASASPQHAQPELLSTACETSIALAAAPAHLRDGAGVWVLEAGGHRLARESTNGFECIVNRDHARVLKPTCFDAEGAATIIPKIRRFGDGLLAGSDAASIQADIGADFAAGRLRSPARTGVAYMLSGFNRPYNPAADSLGWFPPHMMFYAPGVTNEDIGSSWQLWSADSTLPVVGYQGPQGFIIVAVPDAPLGPPSAECPAWVTEGIPQPLSE